MTHITAALREGRMEMLRDVYDIFSIGSPSGWRWQAIRRGGTIFLSDGYDYKSIETMEEGIINNLVSDLIRDQMLAETELPVSMQKDRARFVQRMGEK